MQNPSKTCLGSRLHALAYRGALAFVASAILCLVSIPAHADDIVAVVVPTVTFTGNAVCGANQTSVCAESFSASFEWDNTTETLVPGSAQITATGPLGTLSYLNSFFIPPQPLDPTELILVNWANSAGSGVAADVVTTPLGLLPGVYPIVGPFQAGDAGAGLGCVYLDTACVSEFLGGSAGEYAPSPMVVTAVPEATSLTLLLAVLPAFFAFCYRLRLPR
jgi:hypothetical protein